MRTRLAPLLVMSLWILASCGTDDPGFSRTNNPTGDMTVADATADITQDTTPPPVDMPSVEEMTPDMAPDMPVEEEMTPDMEPDMPPPPPTPCEADNQCSAPQICVVQTSDGARVCADPAGPGNPGDACVDGSECRSGLCLNGACASPCVIDTDCPGGYECISQTIPIDGGATVDFNVCVEKPTPCLSNGNCPDPAICVIDRSGDPPSLTCQDPIPGGKDLGESCQADGECLSGLCLDNLCTRPCERPNDCSTDGSYICEPTDVTVGGGGTATVNVCKPRPATQCLSDSQCTAPERCVAQRGAREVEFVCGTPNAGAGDVGATCANDGQCAQNFCLEGKCAPPCQSTGDCAAVSGFSCELRDVTLQNNNTDSVQVCVPPTPCAESGECKINEACYFARKQSSVESFCRAPNVAGGTLGQVCSADSECGANLCLDARFGQVCSNPCTDDSDCAVTGYSCQDANVRTTGGQLVSSRVCAPRTPPACTSNDACATGLTCAVVPNDAGTALVSACIPASGKLATGVACNMDDDCASRVCEGGFCGDPCTDSTQCSASQLCLTQNLTKGALSGAFDVCITPADTQCTSTGDCTDGVRVCGDLRIQAGTVTPFCRFPISGGAQLGSDCTTNTQCREGSCLPTLGECSVACAADTDCSAAASQVCSTFTFGPQNDVEMCVRSCSDNGSCGTGDICTINSDVPNNDIDQICRAPIGTKELGDTCTGPADCLTGLCLETRLTDPNAMCSSDAQCIAGQTCECPIDEPGCATTNPGARRCTESTNRCSRICNDAGDCQGGVAGNQLVSCSTDVFVTRPDGQTTKLLSFCGEMQ